MVTKANRDVLFFDTNFQQKKFFKIKLEVPLHKKCIQIRECPRLLLGQASLTVEAAFCGTMFFLALFSFLFLFRFLNGYEKDFLTLDAAVKEYECFGTRISTGKGLAEQKLIHFDKEEKVCSLRSIGTIPFIGTRFFSLYFYQQLCINPYEGKSMVPEKDTEERYVFLAEHGTVYHIRPDCVFLNPRISQVTEKEALAGRNYSGAKYYACKSCAKGGSMPHLVYLTPYGDSWHTRKDCSRLKRTVRKVPLSSIGNLPACSKCGR